MRLLTMTLCLTLAGCVTAFHKDRTGEGTWNLSLTDIEHCHGGTEEAVCLQKLMPKMKDKAVSLCGQIGSPNINGCIKNQVSGMYAISCKMKCVPTTSVATIRSNHQTLDSDEYSIAANQFATLLHEPTVKNFLKNQPISHISKTGNQFLIKTNKGNTCALVKARFKKEKMNIESISRCAQH